MRTTLDIEDDILNATREIARQSNQSAGTVISHLQHVALQGQPTVDKGEPGIGGFRPFASRGAVVGDETINQIRDQEGI